MMSNQGIESRGIEVPTGGEPMVESVARGTVRIAPAVLIELIELTVRDVSGVTGFQSRHRVERILPGSHESHPASEGGRDIESRGVRVHLTDDTIDAGISITVESDVNLAEVSQAIRRQVGIAVPRMLGLEVRAVDVYIAGVKPAQGE
jgi:uncharacterized alkaline shock family protein YloU